jgi:hypothetical protein
MPQVTDGAMRSPSSVAVVVGVGLARDRAPPRHGPLEGLARGRELAAAQIVEGQRIWIHVAAARPTLDGHVAHGQAFLERHGLQDHSAVLVGVSRAPLHAQRADDGENHVLGVDASRELPRHVDAAHLRAREAQALRGEHVPHLGGADAEGHSAEGAVGGRVTVAAGDGHARLREAEFRADHVHDALAPADGVEEPDPRLGRVPLQGRHHVLGQRIRQRPFLGVGGNDVVDGGEGAPRVAHAQTSLAQHGECLGARDLVDQVQPDEELALSARQLAHRVQIPDFVEEGSVTHGASGDSTADSGPRQAARAPHVAPARLALVPSRAHFAEERL